MTEALITLNNTLILSLDETKNPTEFIGDLQVNHGEKPGDNVTLWHHATDMWDREHTKKTPQWDLLASICPGRVEVIHITQKGKQTFPVTIVHFPVPIEVNVGERSPIVNLVNTHHPLPK